VGLKERSYKLRDSECKDILPCGSEGESRRKWVEVRCLTPIHHWILTPMYTIFHYLWRIDVHSSRACSDLHVLYSYLVSYSTYMTWYMMEADDNVPLHYIRLAERDHSPRSNGHIGGSTITNQLLVTIKLLLPLRRESGRGCFLLCTACLHVSIITPQLVTDVIKVDGINPPIAQP
jgi:hypothetical protein